MAEDKGFEVVDKRGANSGGESQKASEPEPEQKEQAEPEPQAGGGAAETKEAEQAKEAAEEKAAGEEAAPEGMPVGDVYSLIGLSIMMLAESAWAWMGVRVNPATGKVEKDLGQAKIAIDSVVFLTDKIASHISEEERQALRSMISDLQVNFVQQANRTE